MALVKLKGTQEEHGVATKDGSLPDLLARLRQADLVRTPLDIYEVAHLLGLRVQEEIMDDNLSGYLERRGSHWVAGINALQHRNRQRFTLAHEIAHYLLHRTEQEKFVDEVFSRRTGTSSGMEREADEFAAELLMPEKDVRQRITEGMRDLLDLSKVFGVSTLAMQYRVKELGYKVG